MVLRHTLPTFDVKEDGQKWGKEDFASLAGMSSGTMPDQISSMITAMKKSEY